MTFLNEKDILTFSNEEGLTLQETAQGRKASHAIPRLRHLPKERASRGREILRACCSALGLPYLALPFGGGALTEVLHDLLCGLALSPVRHDLP